MDEMTQFLDLLRKVNTLMKDSNAEYATAFDSFVKMDADETLLTITLSIIPPQLPEVKATTKKA